MWQKILHRTIERVMTWGQLTVNYPDGSRVVYGPGGGIVAEATLKTPQIVSALCRKPILAVGEGYMNGEIEVEGDKLFELLTLLVRNQRRGGMPFWFGAWMTSRRMMRGFVQRNNPLKSIRNVAHHYDISDDFYRLFLDTDMQYSCAYFPRPDMTLEEAQEAKKAHIAAKLRLKPGLRVLDIGCGWGGMALTLARDYGVHVTGVTLSKNQLATARARATEAGLDHLIDFRLCDYRTLNETFDRIVSVGMLEHVGLPQFDTYFSKTHDLLAEDGIALIHTIGRVAPPSPTNPWIEKYIFPGGYIPTLSDLTPSIEKSGLWTADIEVWRGQYGPILHHWAERFEAALPEVRKMYDERFIRMWRFYLVACEMAFEDQSQAVFHFQLSRGQHAVPLTRDYLCPATADAQSARAAE